MPYAAPPEVIALARLRVDREDGPGTWDDMVKRVFEGGPGGGPDRVYDRLCTAALGEASNDIRDVKLVLSSASQ